MIVWAGKVRVIVDTLRFRLLIRSISSGEMQLRRYRGRSQKTHCRANGNGLEKDPAQEVVRFISPLCLVKSDIDTALSLSMRSDLSKVYNLQRSYHTSGLRDP